MHNSTWSRFGRNPVKIFPQLTGVALAAASLNDKIVSLWLPQVLQLLSVRPISHFSLSLPCLVQIIDDRLLPSLKTISVHKPALRAARVVADQLDWVGDIKDVLTLSTTQTQKILQQYQFWNLTLDIQQLARWDGHEFTNADSYFWSRASDLVKMIFLKILCDLFQVIVVNLNLSWSCWVSSVQWHSRLN